MKSFLTCGLVVLGIFTGCSPQQEVESNPEQEEMKINVYCLSSA